MSDPTGSWIMDNGIWRGRFGSADIVPVVGDGGTPTTTPPDYVGGGGGRAGVGSVSCPWPTGHVSGDIGVLVVETNAQTIATPSGWTIFPGAPWSTGTAGAAGSVGLYLFWKRATSSSESNVTVPDSGDHQAGRILGFRGCIETGTPLDANFGTGTNGTASTSITWPSFATTVDNTRVVFVGAWGADTASDNMTANPSNASVAGLVNVTDTNTSAGNGGGFGAATGTVGGAGAVGTTTLNGLVIGSKTVYVAFALLPAAAGTPPTGGSGRTMFASEGYDANPSLIGTAVTPDTLIGDTSASAWITATTGWIDRLTANSACAIMKVHPPNNSKNGDGTWKIRDDTTLDFSVSKWNAIWDSFWSAIKTSSVTVTATATAAAGAGTISVSALSAAIPIGGYVEFGGSKYAKLTAAAASGATSLTVAPLTLAVSSGNSGAYAVGWTKLRTAVANGVIRALYVLDDFVGGAAPVNGVPKGNSFTHAVTYEQQEAICQHAKADAPWLPCFARGGLDSIRTLSLSGGVVRKYVWLDCGMCAYRPRSDWRIGAVARIDKLVKAGRECGVAALGWNNILNWGTGDSTKNGGFGCISGDDPNFCGESPSEVLESLRALANHTDANGNPDIHAIVNWAYNFGPGFWGRTDIQASFSTIASEISGRTEGPINIRTGTDRHLDPA